MTRQKTTKELHIEELGYKRDELIIKVIGNLYKGKINDLFWNNKGHLQIVNNINGRNWNHPIQNISEAREMIMKNIHSVAEVFKEKCPEHLDILEFLLGKIEDGWNWKSETEIEQDIKEIKERCGSILMLLTIEAGN